QHLPGNRLCGIRSEKDRQRSDVFRIDETFERLYGHRLCLDLFDRLAAHFCTSFEYPLNPRAVNGARKNCIGAYSEAAKFDGERFGEPDQSPFGRAIRAAVGISETAGYGRHVDDD